SRRTYTLDTCPALGLAPPDAARPNVLHGVTAELVAQRGHRFQRGGVLLTRTKTREERGRDDMQRNGQSYRLVNRLPAFARVFGEATQTLQLRIRLERSV